ncbi:MAG: RNA polymerase sigma factor [Cyclobacteriaceae bacterium]
MKNAYHVDQAALAIEREWIKEAKKDPKRFSPLYDRYFEAIFIFIYRRTANEDLAADLCSGTFLKALQYLKRYEDRGLPFAAWLYRIASNEVNKYYRKTNKRMVFSLEESIVGKMLEEEESSLTEELTAELSFHLAALSTTELMILELRFFESKGFKEIAYILEITESAAKMRTYRAIDKLKGLFQTSKAPDHDKA